MRNRRTDGVRGAARLHDAGLSLIELVVAITVFAVISGGVALTMTSGLDLSRTNRDRTVAANLASQVMDRVRQQTATLADFQSFTTDPTYPVGGAPRTYSFTIDNGSGVKTGFTAQVSTAWEGFGAGKICSQAVGNGNIVAQLLRVNVKVTWNAMQGVPPVTSSTAIAPPSNLATGDAGNIAVQVDDASANGAPGIDVYVWPNGSTTPVAHQQTDSTGCAFFQGLPTSPTYASYYNVGPKVPGYVDPSGDPAPFQPAPLERGQTLAFSFNYDRETSVTANVTPAPGGGPLPPDLGRVGITLANPGLPPDGVGTCPGSFDSTRCTVDGRSGIFRVTGLFPFPSGYDVWPGLCNDSDPHFYDPPGATETAGTQPGASPITLELQTLEIDYTIASGTRPTLVATDASDTCDPDVPGQGVITLGRVKKGTGTFKIALPYGEWQISVKGSHSSTTGSWPCVWLAPTDPDTGLAGSPSSNDSSVCGPGVPTGTSITVSST